MRSTAETLELDLSLRQSRTIYVSLAIIFFPIALAGIVYGFSAIGPIIDMLSGGQPTAGPGRVALAMVLGVLFPGVEYAIVSQILEANRRLRILREHPNQTVRKLPAPFQTSMFGPYH